MNHKRRKSRKRARCYSSQLGPRDAGGDGWRRGNYASRFRVKDHGRKVADMEEMEVDAQMNIRVVLNNTDPTAGGIEMYRIPVEGVVIGKELGEFGTGLRAGAQRSVLDMAKRMLEDEPLVREVRARHGDVEVRLDVMLDEVRQKKGIAAVTPLVEHIVSRLAEEFSGPKAPSGRYLFHCPICLKDVERKDWDEWEDTCESCRWDKEEGESLWADWADESR